jgi:hypothetical protein
MKIEPRLRTVRRVPALAAALVLAALAALAALTVPIPEVTAQQPPDGCPPTSAQVDVTLRASTIIVDPESAMIYLKPEPGQPGAVCWKVQELKPGMTLHIAGKDAKNDPFPELENTVELPRTTALSGPPTVATTWPYKLWVTEEGQQGPIAYLDPEVIIGGGDVG